MKYEKGDLIKPRIYDSATPPIWIITGHMTNQNGMFYRLRSLCPIHVSCLRTDYVEEAFEKVD
jgi:hypothetical protein